MRAYRRAGVLAAVGIPLAAGLLASGCVQETKVESFQYHEGVTPSDYYPLEVGWAWSFDLTVHAPEGVQQILSTTKVVSADGERRVLRSGQSEFAYRVGVDGIVKEQANYAVLRGPIRTGTSWPLELADGMQGELRITDVHATVETPAGRFSECVVTEESVPALQLLVRTTFAPGVGIVRLQEYGLVEDQQIPTRELVLKAFEEPDLKK